MVVFLTFIELPLSGLSLISAVDFYLYLALSLLYKLYISLLTSFSGKYS